MWQERIRIPGTAHFIQLKILSSRLTHMGFLWVSPADAGPLRPIPLSLPLLFSIWKDRLDIPVRLHSRCLEYVDSDLVAEPPRQPVVWLNSCWIAPLAEFGLSHVTRLVGPCLATGDRISCDNCDRIPKRGCAIVCD